MQRLLYGLIGLLWCYSLMSQTGNFQVIEKQVNTGNVKWYQLDSKANIKATHFFDQYGSQLGLDENSEMIIQKTNKGDGNQVHYRYQQYYDNVKVLGSEMILHEENNTVTSMNGIMTKELKIQTIPGINKEVITQIALHHLPSLKYAWENDPTLKPDPELIIMDKAYPHQSGEFVLAYKVDIYSLNPLTKMRYYLDANNGEIILSHSVLFSCFGGGSLETLYHGVHDSETNLNGGDFELSDQTRGDGIETVSASGRKYKDQDNIWEKGSFAQKKGALDAHFGSQSTYDFYKKYLNRDGINGKNGKLTVKIIDSVAYVNAFWDGSSTNFGIGDDIETGPLTSLDVVGHEMSHGLTEFTCKLEYLYESGALNEGFSDIFGKAVDKEYDPTNFSWLLGSRFFFKPDTAFRSMSNPNRFLNPMYYKGKYWVRNSGDNGGVHTNSGVINFWFYLLSEGGSGTNEGGIKYDVKKLGMEPVIKILYQCMDNYLISNSIYFDVREATLLIAQNLYGKCSDEYRNIAEAWKAVGMGIGVSENDLLLVNNKIPTVACKEGLFPVEVRLVNQSCDNIIPVGTDIQFTISIPRNNSKITENYTTTKEILPGESFVYKFINPAKITVSNTSMIIQAYLANDMDTSNNRFNLLVTKNNNSDHDFRVTGVNISGSPCESKLLRASVNSTFNGCTPVPPGTELDVVLNFGNQIITKKVKTVTTIFPGANFRSSSFDIDRTFAGSKKILASLNYSLDTVPTNNDATFNAVYINNAAIGYLETYDQLKYDSSLLAIRTDSFQILNIQSDFIGSPSLFFTGGNIYSNTNRFIPTNGPSLANFFSSNPKFTSTMYLCIDTKDLTRATLSFDYIQKLGTTKYDSLGLTSPSFAAATRVVFKNDQGQNIPNSTVYIQNATTEVVHNYFENSIPLTGTVVSIEISNITLEGGIDSTTNAIDINKDFVLIDNLEISADIVKTNQQTQLPIQIEPNPFYNHIILHYSENRDVSNYRLLNSFGVILRNGTVLSNSTEINTVDLPSGSYYIQLYNSKGLVSIQKLVKP